MFCGTITKDTQPAGLSVNVTGPQIELITDVPSLNGDALLALGPDAAAALETAYQEKCPNVAMLSSVQGAKTVVFATQTNGGKLVTAVPSPTVDSTT